MEGENRRSSWKIWVYLTPVYILAAIPLVKWTMKINSPDVKLSRDEYGAFNATEGEVKKEKTDQYDPGLSDSGYSIRYRNGKAGEEQPLSSSDRDRAEERSSAQASSGRTQGNQAAAPNGPPYKKQAANPAALESSDTRDKEKMSMGAQKGYLTEAVGGMMGSPKAVGALMNNSWVVKGFMGRGTVQSALGSPQGLKNLLSDTQKVNNFLSNSVVQAALNNPAIVNAFATSAMAKAILSSPAVSAMLQDPNAASTLIATNPQAMQLLSNPNVINALASNPQTAGLAGGLGGGKIGR
jgi:hypothetical protein